MEVFNIFFACADVWVVGIKFVSKFNLLVELSGSIVEGSEEHPNVDETTGEGTSEGVETLDHVE